MDNQQKKKLYPADTSGLVTIRIQKMHGKVSGWEVGYRTNGRRVQTYFSFAQYGTPEKALVAAKKCQEEQMLIKKRANENALREGKRDMSPERQSCKNPAGDHRLVII